jgi:dethiobiotin synthetase
VAGDPSSRLTGVFVTGTDTGVGKSVVSACLVAALRARGERVAAVKPVLTGLDEPPGPGEWPTDHELLATAAGSSPRDVTAFTFGPAVSPHLAAELAGAPLDADAVVEETRTRAAAGDVAVVEGVGGLLVPIAPGLDVRDLALALGLPLVIVARPGLGTINHTLLTLEAARASGLDVRAVVLNPWPDEPTVMERSNRETIERLGEVEVLTLGETSQDRLAASGGPLADAICR